MDNARCFNNQRVHLQIRMMIKLLIVIAATTLLSSSALAQTFDVDFSRPSSEPPLVKTKFGVYQTPLTTLPQLLDSVPLLREINVSDLRYEMGWGKPDVMGHSQIGGTAEQPTYDFRAIDALVGRLRQADVRPLLAMGYCPDPLKSRTGWASWKDLPRDLTSWQGVNRAYAFHLKSQDSSSPFYEVWNEPDMPEPGGKMFFGGTPGDYGQLYAHAARGLKQGDPDALVGGPAVAYDLAYLAPILSRPMDFASIHGYNNFPVQVGMMRGALAARPDLPIFLSEYASYTDFPPNGPQSHSGAAMRFFRDVKGLLGYTDVTKVYWAQWLDAGQSPGMGLVTFDGHRKAIFNAFKIYGALPVDRNSVEPNGSGAIDALASSDKHTASVVLWNTSASECPVWVKLNRLPFSRGTLQVCRIDQQHASYVDNPASENLETLQSVSFNNSTGTSWSGILPAEGVVYLKLFDGSTPAPRNKGLGTIIHSYHWFPERNSNAYADFDARTATARIGIGDKDSGVAQIGNVVENPAQRLRVEVSKSGPFLERTRNSLFGLRIDFQSWSGGYSKSVLFHNGLYNPQRDSALPWGRGGALPDQATFQNALKTGGAFQIKLSRIAPRDWNHKRIILTFVMQDAGAGSRARFVLTGI